MAKLIVTENGFLAHGKNALAQRVIDVPSFLPAPVASPALLPTNWNTLGAPEDGTIGIVDQGAGAGYYIYKAAVDALPFDHWLDAATGVGGVTYYRDTIDNAPGRISVLNGDTDTDILSPARSWTASLSAGGSLGMVGAGLTRAIRLVCGATQTGSIISFNAIEGTQANFLLLLKLAIGGGTAPARPSGIGTLVLRNSNMGFFFLSTSYNGFFNRYAWVGGTLAGQMDGLSRQPGGFGLAQGNPFERFDTHGSWNYPFVNTAVGDYAQASGGLSTVSFDRGNIPGVTEAACNGPQRLSSGGSALLNIGTASATGGTETSIDIQEVHMLRKLAA